MANDTVTLALDGDVSLSEFAEAVDRFDGLVRALARAEKVTHVQWMVAQLEVSSTLATARGISSNAQPVDVVKDEVERVVRGYLRVGHSLEHGEPFPYSAVVERQARGITGILNGRITSVRFETAEAEAVVAVSTAGPKSQPLPPSYGAVEGRIQTLTSRGGLRFTLYDTFFDKAVSCYLAEGYEDVMRDAWGRRAVVEGLVTRDAQTGRPLAVRGVTHVEVLPEVPLREYRKLRGIAPRRTISAEEAIRRLRDAG